MKSKKVENITIKKQTKHPMEAKGIDMIFYPSTRGTKVPKRTINIFLNETTGIKITTSLSQSHRNILNLIMALAYNNNTYTSLLTKENLVETYYFCKWSDLYKIFNGNIKWILQHIEDMLQTLITLHTEKNGIEITRTTGLVPEYGFLSTQKSYGNSVKEKFKEILKSEKQKKKSNPNWFIPKKGDILWIKMSFAWFVLMQFSKVRTNYSPEFLCNLLEEPGIIQSAIMFITKQQVPFQIGAEKLFERIKPDWNTISRQAKHKLFTILEGKIDTFKKYNIDYDSDKHKQLFSYYTPCKGVGFSIPIPELRDKTAKQIEQYLEEKSES